MKSSRLARLKLFALLFMVPGLAGLIISAMISVSYLDTLPRGPAPEQLRTEPRNIHGVVVYQTAEEDRKLNLIEYSSVGVFVIGLWSGLVYLENWGSRRVREPAEDDKLTQSLG
jgi:hypothetical protein